MLQKCLCFSKGRTVPPEHWKICLNIKSLGDSLKLLVLNVTTTFTGKVRIMGTVIRRTYTQRYLDNF
jgi:hypothetical protein